MTSVPKSLLFVVAAILGALAVFGLASGISTAFNRGAPPEEGAAPPAAGQIQEAQPLESIPPPPPPPEKPAEKEKVEEKPVESAPTVTPVPAPPVIAVPAPEPAPPPPPPAPVTGAAGPALY